MVGPRLAEAFKIIYRHEHAHYRQGRAVFDRLAESADPSEFREATAYARELARRHFILRNDSFGRPLGPDRVKEIEAGKVVPYLPPSAV